MTIVLGLQGGLYVFSNILQLRTNFEPPLIGTYLSGGFLLFMCFLSPVLLERDEHNLTLIAGE
jgi:hypothetical protein